MNTAQRLTMAAAVLLMAAAGGWERTTAAPPPSVVLIITDDQGYGDLGAHGNPALQTPHLDRLARDSVRFDAFYVSPVCSPTRASLLTGRYNYRTAVVDTYLGRSLMHPGETTIAERLARGGYRTGIFGKWHLGDTFPMRGMDQGFQESLTLNGGGIGQPSDPPGGESYFDPLLRRNGSWVRTKGYVSDVITDAAIDFIRRSRDRPFFAYLAFNAPHTPLEVPADKYAKYKAMNLTVGDVPAAGHPVSPKFDPDTTAKIYGMVENIDDNVGRVLAALDELKLTENTIVIFLTDNGPQQPRYNAGMLRLKGTVNEGGIRVPFFVRWPGRFESGRRVDRIAAHIDVTPTLVELCGVSRHGPSNFDGRSLRPLLEGRSDGWPDRTLFFQWHRGDVPQMGRAFAVRTQQYKLVQWQGVAEGSPTPQAAPELFDMTADPLETRDLARERPEEADRLRRAYGAWFEDVTAERDYTDKGAPRIHLGDARENPVRLTRQDWRGPHAGWTPKSNGHWLVDVRRGGRYTLTARFPAVAGPAVVRLAAGGTALDRAVAAGATSVTFENVRLEAGPATLAADVGEGAQRAGVTDLVVTRR